MSENYPLNWSELKIKYFEQIKYKSESPQNLRRSTRYYLMKFDQFQAKPFWIDWNWAAFGSGSFWSGLRGVYLPFLIIMFNGVFNVILSSSASLFNVSTFVKTVSFVNTLLLFVILTVNLLSNRLYIDKILKKIERKDIPKPPHILNGFCCLIIFLSLNIFIFPHLNTFALNKSCKTYLIKGEKSSKRFLDSVISEVIFESDYKPRHNNTYRSNIYTAAFLENPQAVAHLKEALKDPTFEPSMTTEDRRKILETLFKIKLPITDVPDNENVAPQLEQENHPADSL